MTNFHLSHTQNLSPLSTLTLIIALELDTLLPSTSTHIRRSKCPHTHTIANPQHPSYIFSTLNLTKVLWCSIPLLLFYPLWSAHQNTFPLYHLYTQPFQQQNSVCTTLHSTSTLPSKPHNQQQKINANCTLTLPLSTIYSAANQKQQLNSSPSIPTVNTTSKIAQLHTITPPSKFNSLLRLSHSTNNTHHQSSVHQRQHFLSSSFYLLLL